MFAHSLCLCCVTPYCADGMGSSLQNAPLRYAVGMYKSRYMYIYVPLYGIWIDKAGFQDRPVAQPSRLLFWVDHVVCYCHSLTIMLTTCAVLYCTRQKRGNISTLDYGLNMHTHMHWTLCLVNVVQAKHGLYFELKGMPLSGWGLYMVLWSLCIVQPPPVGCPISWCGVEGGEWGCNGTLWILLTCDHHKPQVFQTWESIYCDAGVPIGVLSGKNQLVWITLIFGRLSAS